MAIKFVEGGTVHSLPWSELLTLDEVPFESLEAVDECGNVLAPWWDESTLTVKHAEAVIVRKGVLKCVLLVYVLQSHNVNSYNVGSKKSPTKGGKKRSSPIKGKRKATTQRTPSKKDSKKVHHLMKLGY